VPRERVVFSRNEKYCETARIPKCDGMVTLPMPDPVTRASALLTGLVDWVEAPAPDMIARLKQGGMEVITNDDPHMQAQSWFQDLTTVYLT
jgi:peptide/nickel transport system substrate-binding protein